MLSGKDRNEMIEKGYYGNSFEVIHKIYKDAVKRYIATGNDHNKKKDELIRRLPITKATLNNRIDGNTRIEPRALELLLWATDQKDMYQELWKQSDSIFAMQQKDLYEGTSHTISYDTFIKEHFAEPVKSSRKTYPEWINSLTASGRGFIVFSITTIIAIIFAISVEVWQAQEARTELTNQVISLAVQGQRDRSEYNAENAKQIKTPILSYEQIERRARSILQPRFVDNLPRCISWIAVLICLSLSFYHSMRDRKDR